MAKGMDSIGALPYTIVVILTVALHFVFLGYLIVGGFLAWRWPATFGLHIAAVVWGAASLTVGLPCPLTDLERYARARAGMADMAPGGFIEHYLTGVLYPVEWTTLIQALAFVAVLLSWVGLNIRNRRRPAATPAR